MGFIVPYKDVSSLSILLVGLDQVYRFLSYSSQLFFICTLAHNCVNVSLLLVPLGHNTGKWHCNKVQSQMFTFCHSVIYLNFHFSPFEPIFLQRPLPSRRHPDRPRQGRVQHGRDGCRGRPPRGRITRDRVARYKPGTGFTK
jgi:hypothetical protein